MKGSLEVIVGSMFSGKSEELLRRGKRHMYGGANVLFVKPTTDNRQKGDKIYTHDGNHIDALVLDDITELVDYTEYDVICIDEIQFFHDLCTEATVEQLILEGIKVIASGLDMDRHGEPFGIVPWLMIQAEELTKLHAVCVDCGDDAWISHGEFKSDSQIEVGAQEKYVPLCRTCNYTREEAQ